VVEIITSLIRLHQVQLKETIKYPKIKGGVSATFIAGTVQTDFDYSNDPFIHEVESAKNRQQALAYHNEHSLTITFKLSQKRDIIIPAVPQQVIPKLIEANVGSDGYSVKVAMDHYIKETDHCVFTHSMSHIGVHTTAILPSIFKATTVTFADTGPRWVDQISKGYAYTVLLYHVGSLYISGRTLHRNCDHWGRLSLCYNGQ
jgi:hypothetical protein